MEYIKDVEVKNYKTLGKIYFPEFGGYKVMSFHLAEIAKQYGFYYDKPNLRITPEEKAYLLMFETMQKLRKIYDFDKQKQREFKRIKIENLVIYKKGENFKYGVRFTNKIEAYIEKDIFYSLTEKFPTPLKRN